MDKKDNSNFRGLVSGISKMERQVLLDNITKKSPEESDAAIPLHAEEKDAPSIELIKKFKEMSLFRRIWFKIKSIVTSVPIEGIVNEYFVKRIGGAIEKTYPGLLNFRKQRLEENFYDRLLQLKGVCDFFAPYMYDVEGNPDAFYVLLGTIVMPEVANQIETESDPYQYPFTKELNNEMRVSLIHKMEAIQDSIPLENKAAMYANVRAVEWLRNFVRLPFDKFLSKFTDENGIHVCAFNQVTNEMAAFARVFDDLRPVTDEILNAIHLRIQATSRDLDEGINDRFLDLAQNQLGVIAMFASSIPVMQVAKVVQSNALYIPETMSGGEDWLARYKAQQKINFDRNWARWLHDYKKNQIKNKMAGCFGVSAFPMFPSRPWEKVWTTGTKFNYSLTLGFMYFFLKSVYPAYSELFKIISLEADFTIKENRLEFTDTINEYNHLCDEMDILMNQLAKGGEFGQSLLKYSLPGSRNKNSEERVGVMISEIEKSAQSILNGFGKSSRSMESILLALDGEKITPYYGPLTNLAHIQGPQNKAFRENLTKVRQGIGTAYEIAGELEVLDKEDY